jgi:hypothetical protein
MTASRPMPNSARVSLGALGMAGGVGLLAAFAVDIPPALNTWRIVLFNTGAITIVVATYGPNASVSRPLALAGAIPVVLANVAAIAWILLAIGRESPFTGGLGRVGFWAGLAVWLADAWFGLVALRLRRLWRLGALALVIGSLLAITGMDRLGLTSGVRPTVFGPISLVGITLNGTAWILLGVQLAAARNEATPQVPSRA